MVCVQSVTKFSRGCKRVARGMLHRCWRVADAVVLLVFGLSASKVFAPASEPHHLLLSDSIVRSAEASAAGKVLNPEDSEEVRVQRFVQVSRQYPVVQ